MMFTQQPVFKAISCIYQKAIPQELVDFAQKDGQLRIHKEGVCDYANGKAIKCSLNLFAKENGLILDDMARAQNLEKLLQSLKRKNLILDFA